MTDSNLILGWQEAAALDYANDVIEKFGGPMQSELQRGNPGEGTCPVAMTIKAALPEFIVQVRPANRDLMLTPGPMAAIVTLPLPRTVAEFAIDFDYGKYPRLRTAA